jgi:hypothetical protein
MNEHAYDDLALEKAIHAHFGLGIEVDSVIARRIPVSRTAQATVFLTNKKQLFTYIESQSSQSLSDVQKVVNRMGLKAEQFLPPKGRPNYFDEIGTKKFREVFPGRGNITSLDIQFYRTLAPYSPALVVIREVKDGAIYQYDADSSGGWRQSVKFSYRRIKTS